MRLLRRLPCTQRLPMQATAAASDTGIPKYILQAAWKRREH